MTQPTSPASAFWQLVESDAVREASAALAAGLGDGDDVALLPAWQTMRGILAQLVTVADAEIAKLKGDAAAQTWDRDVAAYARAFHATYVPTALDRWHAEYEACRHRFITDYRRNHGTVDGAEQGWHASHVREDLMARKPSATDGD